MRTFMLYISLAVASLAITLYACGNGGGGGEKGQVAFYIADEMMGYEAVAAFANSVEILNTGSGALCNVAGPLELEITEFSGVLDLLNVSVCPRDSYNRIRFTFARDVTLTNTSGVTNACSFTSYLDVDDGQPKVLECSGENCTLDLNGAVNVFASQPEKLALDFELKDFIVHGFDNPLEACTVTMKVTPLNASAMKGKGYAERVEGFISDLTGTSFVLTKGNLVFNVDYSVAEYLGTPQADLGIFNALTLAEDDHLRVRVFTNSVDFSTIPYEVDATKVFVKAEGTVSGLDDVNHAFVLNYETKSIAVDYQDAFDSGRVEGVLANGDYVDVRLFGYDAVGRAYLAHKVEVTD